MPDAISSGPLSGYPISGSDSGNGPIDCFIGALGAFAFGSGPLDGTCDAPVPPTTGVCELGALGGFAFGGIAISGNLCFIPPGPPAPPIPSVDRGGHPKNWRPIVDRTTRLIREDEEIAVWLNNFLSRL